MLTCICINEDDDEDSDVQRLQWFTGKCDLSKCKKKITKACYAFRLPLDKGGWVGCFCSSKCAMTEANIHITDGIHSEDNFEHFKQFNEIEALVLFKGILDRDDLYEHENQNDLYYTNKNK